MPIGIIINVCSVALGGTLGSFIGNKLSEDVKEQMNMIFGICALSMGISSVVLMKNMPAVVFSVIFGSLVGMFLKIGSRIQNVMKKTLSSLIKTKDDKFWNLLLTAAVLFCASGTGIYGSLDSGMTGNHTILISKSVLDFFTAMIFACRLGKATSFIAIPQAVIMGILFALAKVVFPMTNSVMIADFKSCGGFILLATGIQMMKLRDLPIVDMIPSMILVMPISYFWVEYILPLIG